MMPERPRLTPAMADVRRAVRELLASTVGDGELVLVALSGGPDSLALAAATAFEAPRGGLRAGAIIVDHGLQAGSAEVALAAAEQARALGLDPVDIRRVEVLAADGPEADARSARYAALERAHAEHGAAAVLLGHTLDDQAETVLLGLTRGAGATSLAGMSAVTGFYLRPLLGIRRSETVAACVDQGLTAWSDPHNNDRSYTRVRIRTEVMPVLESQLGPGVAEALARTADQLRGDAAVLDSLARDALPTVLLPTPGDQQSSQVALDAGSLGDMPAAIHNRLIRLTALSVFGVSLSQAHTAAIAALVTNWHGQGEAHVPGIRVERQGFRLVFRAANPADEHSTKE
jgi:tRNA(Ile)-lysidine synthase